MPCYDPYPDRDLEEAQRRLDAHARMLCNLCFKLETLNMTHLMSAETLAWWLDHKRKDAERNQ